MNEADQCPGTNRQGEQCGHPKGWGTNHPGEGHCKHHGGAAPQVEDAIERRLQEAGELSSKALLLMLERRVEALEDGEMLPSKEVDRLSRTVLDRIGFGKTEKREHSGEIDTGVDSLVEALQEGYLEQAEEDNDG